MEIQTLETSRSPSGRVFRIKAYILLAKPGIIMGNAITGAAGFILGSHGRIDVYGFMATLLGLSLIMASACVFNNYIDRHADAKMSRTRYRALVQEEIAPHVAIVFAIILCLAGSLTLALFSTYLALAFSLLGFFVYVVLYSLSKYHSIHATLIGSIAGAMPPLVGYCAASHALDWVGCILFVMIALWQMPHFFAIAIYRLSDYAAASIPVLPIIKGISKTKTQMLFYLIAFTCASLMLWVFGPMGYVYLTITSLLNLYWLWLCFKGFNSADDTSWARKMFIFSLIAVVGLCSAMTWDSF